MKKNEKQKFWQANTDPSFPNGWGSLSRHTQLCPTLLDPMNCRPPGSFIRGISQARRLEQVPISSSRGSSQLRDQTQVSCIGRQIFFTTSTPWEVGEVIYKLPGLTKPLSKNNSGERRVQARENLWQWKLASTEGFLSAMNWEKCNRYHHI